MIRKLLFLIGLSVILLVITLITDRSNDRSNRPSNVDIESKSSFVETEATSTVIIREQVPESKRQFVISGHFFQKGRVYESAGEQILEEYTCDTLTLDGGDESFIDKYTNLVKSGNTVNYIDSKGNLVINLDLQKLSSDIANAISSSTGVVSILVEEKQSVGKGAEPCHSFIEIISVAK